MTKTEQPLYLSSRNFLERLQSDALYISSLILSIVILSLSGCNSMNKTEQEDSEQQYYQSAQKELQAGRFLAAIERIDSLKSQFPYGRYAEQVQLELIYAHYRNLDYTQTVISAEEFIHLYPNHPQLDYAYYAKGIATFQMDKSLLDKFTPTDISKRDMGAARDSFEDFNEIILRFPNSEYFNEARIKMLFLRNRLADYEVNVANYYMHRQAYVAAANRGQYVVKHFQQSPAVAPALAIMVKAYRKLGLDGLAGDTLEILVLNFPDYEELSSEGDIKSFRHVDDEDPSWLNILSFGLFG